MKCEHCGCLGGPGEGHKEGCPHGPWAYNKALSIIRDSMEQGMRHGDPSTVNINALKNNISKALRQERQAYEQDAKRWRAFLNSVKIRFIGWAGFKDNASYDPKLPYRHFGAEFWSMCGPGEFTSDMTEERARLIEYADACIEVQLDKMRRTPTVEDYVRGRDSKGPII